MVVARAEDDVVLVEGAAALVWDLLDDDLSREALAEAIAGTVSGDAETVLDDALGALRREGLLAGG